mgnify:CR=1 FL=1
MSVDVTLSRQEIEDIYVALAAQRDNLVGLLARQTNPPLIQVHERHLAAVEGLIVRFSNLQEMVNDWVSDVDYSY